jgi:hypothetical protein
MRDNLLSSLINQTSTGEGLLQGAVVLPVTATAITAAGVDGQVNVYRAGASLWLQVFDSATGAWRKVELT